MASSNAPPNFRAHMAFILSVGLIVAVCFVVNDSPIVTVQESFYDLAKDSLTRDESPVDQLALSKSLELSQVPDESALLTDSLIKLDPRISAKEAAVQSSNRGEISLAKTAARSSTAPDQTSLLTDSLVPSKSQPTPRNDAQQSSMQAQSQMLAAAAKAAFDAKMKSDPSWVGYESFNDLLKDAIQKEKQKRVLFHQELAKMGRNSPKYLERQSMKESQIEASDKSRKEEEAGALKKIEAHLTRHIAGILSLNAPVQQQSTDNTEQSNEEYEKLARVKYEAGVKAMRMKRELAMKKADEKAREEMEQHINNDVGSILSSVVPGPGGIKTKSEHVSDAKVQDHKPAHPAQALKSMPGSHKLMKEVKTYIDTEIAKEVHSAATSTKSQSDAAEQLQKLRAYILSGNFQQAVKLASSADAKAAVGKKDVSAPASKVNPLDQSPISNFNALFGKLVKGG
jgi:hypothetical protein